VESAHTLHDAPEGKIRGVAYGVAGLRNSGHGIFGGYPGAPSIMMLMEKTRVQEVMEKNQSPIDVSELGGNSKLLPYCNFEVAQGDILYMRVASGGGYGDPLEREPELVRQDFENGLISKESARNIYGAVIDEADGKVDLAATRELRKTLRAGELKEPE
jgi:N-methylhydantoinase B/oxoprolinase/acetone carboxylase alpha subunit